MTTFQFNEEYLSQIPALQLIATLGYQYLTKKQTLIERGSKKSNILLENILREQLPRLNRIQYKGNEYLFSEKQFMT